MAIPCPSDIYVTLILFIVALSSCAFFAFLETSVATLRLFTIEELERSVSRYPELFAALRFHRHRVLTTMVIANSGATVIATTFSARLLSLLFKNSPHHLELPLTLIVTTTVMLMCGEVIPKHLAKTLGHQLIRSTLWGTNIIYHALYPLVTVLTALSERVVRHIAQSHALDETTYHEHVSREEIQFLINHMHKLGTLSSVQHNLLSRVFMLNSIYVATIMLPVNTRAHTAAAPHDTIATAQTMMPSPIHPEDSAERALTLLTAHHLLEAPVYTTQGELIGIIRHCDIVALLFNEAALPLLESSSHSAQQSLDIRSPAHVSLHNENPVPPLHKDHP